MIDQQPTAPQRGTGLAFVQHWDWVADRGLLPRNSALGIRTAVSKILKIEDDWENLDVREIDVDRLVSRFSNLSKLAPRSLATYESRFRSGLASYLAYLEKPASYQPKARRQAAREERPTVKGKKKPTAPLSRPDDAPSATHPVTSSTRLVVYPLPVRPDVFAELKLPAELTADEATRLGAFLKAVALSAPSDAG